MLPESGVARGTRAERRAPLQGIPERTEKDPPFTSLEPSAPFLVAPLPARRSAPSLRGVAVGSSDGSAAKGERGLTAQDASCGIRPRRLCSTDLGRVRKAGAPAPHPLWLHSPLYPLQVSLCIIVLGLYCHWYKKAPSSRGGSHWGEPLGLSPRWDLHSASLGVSHACASPHLA